MSRFVTMQDDEYIEEIESLGVCRWRINDMCCNDKSKNLGIFPTTGACEDNKFCKDFVKENGVIEDD